VADPLLSLAGPSSAIGEDGLAGLSDASRKRRLRAPRLSFGGGASSSIGRDRQNARPLLAGAVRCRAGAGPVRRDARRRCWPLAIRFLAWRGRKASLGGPLVDGASGSHHSRALDHSSLAAGAARLALGKTLSAWGLSCGAVRAGWCGCLSRAAARIICLVSRLRQSGGPDSRRQWLTGARAGGRVTSLDAYLRSAGPAPRAYRPKAGAGANYVNRVGREPAWRVALQADGAAGLPRSSGLADELFRAHDGQITKRPVRARLALSALAPRPGENPPGDIGAGSGFDLDRMGRLASGTGRFAIEATRGSRPPNIRTNARGFWPVAQDFRLSRECATRGARRPLKTAGCGFSFGGGPGRRACFEAVWPRLAEGAHELLPMP